VLKTFLIVAAVALSAMGLRPAHAAAQAPAAATLDTFTWLVGSWSRQTSRGEAVERWIRTSDDTMEGTSVSVAGGSSRVTEYLRLVRMGSDVFYVAKPGENPLPVAFKLTSADATRVVFENPAHDFPTKITYTRLPADSLVVVIEGPMDGVTRQIPFRFVRKGPT
jgi:hypothetical protein